MTLECDELQDRMPQVAAEASPWTPEEAAHLTSCDGCAAEWRLVVTARRLGAAAAAQVDPARLAHEVLAGVATRNRADRWKRAGWLVGLAAAAALVLVVWRGGQPGAELATVTPAEEFHLPLAELDVLDSPILEAVLEGFDAPVGDGSTVDGPRLGDLDDTQLERVLRSLEG